MIADPPSDDGAVQLTPTCPLPRVAVNPVGAPGIVAGLARMDEEGGPLPTTFVATTVNEYVVPFVRPEIVQPKAAVEHEAPSGEAVAV